MEIKVYVRDIEAERFVYASSIQADVRPMVDDFISIEGVLYKVISVYLIDNTVSVRAEVTRGDFRDIIEYNTRKG